MRDKKVQFEKLKLSNASIKDIEHIAKQKEK
jgi:hypothetical protein